MRHIRGTNHDSWSSAQEQHTTQGHRILSMRDDIPPIDGAFTNRRNYDAKELRRWFTKSSQLLLIRECGIHTYHFASHTVAYPPYGQFSTGSTLELPEAITVSHGSMPDSFWLTRQIVQQSLLSRILPNNL